jgi:hypothetical protein
VTFTLPEDVASFWTPTARSIASSLNWLRSREFGATLLQRLMAAHSHHVVDVEKGMLRAQPQGARARLAAEADALGPECDAQA